MNFQTKLKNSKNNLAIYFTAGYPKLESTAEILKALDCSGADLVEVGLPFSDSLVDGPTIQASNQVALDNGQHLANVLEQLKTTVGQVQIPIVLMGSYNPILQYGMDKFVVDAKQAGVTAVIIPDLPPEIYQQDHQKLFEEVGLGVCFLVTSHTTEERVRFLDSLTTGFIYLVSSDSITGTKLALNPKLESYFQRILSYNLKSPILVGFGISDAESFQAACKYSNGAIIGSHFIKNLAEFNDYSSQIKSYITEIKA